MADTFNAPRTVIMSKIKKGKPQLEPLPDVPMYSFAGDKHDSFKHNLVSFDGEFEEFASREEAINYLRTKLDASKKIFSSVPDYDGTIHLSDFKTPHDAHVVDICVTEGIVGVAETGSVWLTDKSLQLAAAALLSTDMFVLLDKSKIEGSMHEAYATINLRDAAYGAFYTGPSATADIEAVHITGAQGEISLTVLLY
ncbi:MAG: LutC/YkgG family protein [Tannerellaceae bacterium]